MHNVFLDLVSAPQAYKKVSQWRIPLSHYTAWHVTLWHIRHWDTFLQGSEGTYCVSVLPRPPGISCFITRLGVTHFWVHCGVPFSLDVGKGKCCMWPVNKVEIHFAKIGFVDCKWPNLNAPGSSTHCCHSLWGPIPLEVKANEGASGSSNIAAMLEFSFPAFREKREMRPRDVWSFSAYRKNGTPHCSMLRKRPKGERVKLITSRSKYCLC